MQDDIDASFWDDVRKFFDSAPVERIVLKLLNGDAHLIENPDEVSFGFQVVTIHRPNGITIGFPIRSLCSIEVQSKN